eukprot:sb/3468944/
MTRHGKNATASAVYSYHERQKDTAEGSYGTQSAHIGRDSARNFDCCCLTLQPCKDPVTTQEGYLFEREAILTNLLKQKKKIAKAEKAYSKHLKEKSGKSCLPVLLKHAVVPGSRRYKPRGTDVVDKSKQLNNFWVPNLQGHAVEESIKKPDTKTYCPITEKQLKLKDLISVKFTPMPQDNQGTSTICQEVRYMCAVTHDALSNGSTCVVLRPTGNVITLDCYEKLVKEEMVEPLTGEPRLSPL